MIFSTFVVALAFIVAPSLLAAAQERDNNNIDLPLLPQTKKVEKSSNHKDDGGGEKFPPMIRSNPKNDDDEQILDRRRRHRRLDYFSSVVNYPNPCLDLPANRVPEFNSTNPANDGWSLALSNGNGGPATLPLPFTFTLNGQGFTALDIYNNGLLRTGTPDKNLYVFHSLVDTDLTYGGYVWHKQAAILGTNKLALAWDHVGYNDQQPTLNTFQTLISDGNDVSMGLGNNVCYCYQDMQWANYAYVGASISVRFGIFDTADTTYDGGYGNDDGFDFLDNKSICFKASGSSIPPVAVNVPENNRVDLACGEFITNRTIFFLATKNEPVVVSLTTLGASAAGLTVDIVQQPNQATATINWTPTAGATVTVALMASDSIDNTAVNITFTYPGITAQIWNPTTKKFVQDLVHGRTYCLKKYNLRAVPCQKEPLLLELWNRRTKVLLKRQKDYVSPYYLWGSSSGRVKSTGGGSNMVVGIHPNPTALPNGKYALRIKAIHNAATANSSYTEIRFRQSCP